VEGVRENQKAAGALWGSQVTSALGKTLLVLPIRRQVELGVIPDPLLSSPIFKDNLGLPGFFKAVPHLSPRALAISMITYGSVQVEGEEEQ